MGQSPPATKIILRQKVRVQEDLQASKQAKGGRPNQQLGQGKLTKELANNSKLQKEETKDYRELNQERIAGCKEGLIL
jgi:hypothetical protein